MFYLINQNISIKSMFLLTLDFGELVKGDFVSNITAIFTSKISG